MFNQRPLPVGGADREGLHTKRPRTGKSLPRRLASSRRALAWDGTGGERTSQRWLPSLADKAIHDEG